MFSSGWGRQHTLTSISPMVGWLALMIWPATCLTAAPPTSNWEKEIKGAWTNNVLGRWKPDKASIEHRLDAIAWLVMVCHLSNGKPANDARTTCSWLVDEMLMLKCGWCVAQKPQSCLRLWTVNLKAMFSCDGMVVPYCMVLQGTVLYTMYWYSEPDYVRVPYHMYGSVTVP